MRAFIPAYDFIIFAVNEKNPKIKKTTKDSVVIQAIEDAIKEAEKPLENLWKKLLLFLLQL